MSDGNKPKGEFGLVNQTLNLLSRLSSSISNKANKALGHGSKTEQLAESVIEWVEDMKFLIDSVLGKNGDTPQVVIETYIKSLPNNSLQTNSFEELRWPEDKDTQVYVDAMHHIWGSVILEVLYEKLPRDNWQKIGAKRRSQSIRKHVDHSVPSNIQVLVKEGYRGTESVMDFNNDLFQGEIRELENIFTSILNLIFRVNILLDNPELKALVTRFFKHENLDTSINSNRNTRELRRLAFMIQVSKLEAIQKILDSTTLTEIIEAKISAISLETQCVTHGEKFEENDEENKQEEKNTKVVRNAELYACSSKILGMFSEFYNILTPLKRKSDKMYIQREILENILGIKINEQLAEKIFDEESPLYKLIFTNTLSFSDGKSVFHKFSTEFKTFLLRITTKFPKTLQENTSESGFPSLYYIFINLELGGDLNKEKQGNILRFLNTVGNISKNLDFCEFIIGGGLENIDMIPYLNDNDRIFILRFFSQENSNSDKINGEVLRDMSYEDICRLQLFSDSEIGTALQNIREIQALFTKQRLRETIENDLQWIPTNTPGYLDLKNILGEDIDLQAIVEMTKVQDRIYTESEISEAAKTNRVLLGSSISHDKKNHNIETIGEINIVLGDILHRLKRGYIHEIFELNEAKRNIIIPIVLASEGFDFLLSFGKLGDVSEFASRNGILGEGLQDIWSLFTEQIDAATGSKKVEQESDFDIFLEVFGEHLGLRLLVLELPNDINEIVLTIGSKMNPFHIQSFVDFIELKEKALKNKTEKKLVLVKLQRILDFSFLVSNRSHHTLGGITIYFQEIWNLSEESNIIREVGVLLYEISPSNYSLLWDNILNALLQDDISSLAKYLDNEDSIKENTSDEEVKKEHIKLSSLRPREVERKILAFGFQKIPTKSGHNKYRGLNVHNKQVMLILPISKGDTNKYIIEQTIRSMGISFSEWEEL